MSIFTVIAFLISSLYLYLGIKSLLYDYKDNLHIVFSLICLSMILWSSFAGLCYLQETDETLLLMLKLAYIGAFFYFPLNLHFYLILSRIKTGMPILVLIYAPAFLFNIAHAAGYSYIRDFIKLRGNWVARLYPDSIMLHAYCLYLLVCVSVAAALIYRWGKRTTFNKEKQYSFYLFISFVFANAASFITTLVLPILNIVDYQAIGMLLFYLYGMGLFYVITRLRFLNLNYSLMGDEIISNINDVVILLDQNMNIVEVNRRYSELFFISPENMKMKSFLNFICSNDIANERIAALQEKRSEQCDIRIDFRKDDECIAMKTRMSRIKDRFGDFAGFMVIASEVKEIGHFQDYFKISNREMDVIELIIFGCTYRDVASKLNITEKTVESHLAHIYNKLGINNKIELIRVASEFNITTALHN
jgi:PAS domain S-box-containing protein